MSVVKPMSCVTIAMGIVTDFQSGNFDDDQGKNVAWRKIEVAIVGATVTVKPSAEQYGRITMGLKKGDQVTVAGKGSIKDKMPVINDLVSFKVNDVEKITSAPESGAEASGNSPSLTGYPGPTGAAAPPRRSAA